MALLCITLFADAGKNSIVKWEKSPGAIAYSVSVKDSSGKIIFNRRVTGNSAEMSLSKGIYYIQISPINKFNRVDSSDSSWQMLTIRTIARPVIDSVTPDYITPETGTNRITVNGRNLTTDLKVSLVKMEGGKRYPISSVAYVSDRRITFPFDPALTGSGLLNIELRTSDGTVITSSSTIAIGLEAAAMRLSPDEETSETATGHNLIYYIVKGNTRKVDELLKSGVNPDTTDKNGFYAIHYAAFFGHTPIVKLLNSYGAKLEVQDTGGAYPIHHAAYKDRLETVNHLIVNKLNNVNSYARNGYAPLDRAAIRGNYRIIETLIKNGAIVDYIFKSGENALHMAVYSGNLQSVRLLLATGKVDINYQEKRGYTALHYAAWFGHADICEFLINHGADKSIQSNKSETAYILAQNTKRPAQKTRLLELLR